MSVNFKIIVAMCKNNGIGINNTIPWNIPEDLKYFSYVTRGRGNNAVVMGKKTYLSIGKRLPNRTNIILSTSLQNIDDVIICKNIEECIRLCERMKFDEVWIIGGYEQFLNLNIVNEIRITKIYRTIKCDTFFPKHLLKQFTKSLLKKSGTIKYYKYVK